MEYFRKIRDLRIQQQMTQSDLADGITSQSVISKLEKGMFSPDIDLLLQICSKLGVDIHDILSETNNKIDINKDYIVSLLEKRDYLTVENYISEIDISLLSNEDKKYHKWLTLIIQTKNYGKYDQTIDEAIEFSTTLSNNNKFNIDLKVNLYLLISNCYETKSNLNEAIKYLSKALALTNLSIIDPKIKLKTYFNLARTHYILDNFKESVQYAHEASSLTVANDSLYLLEDIYLILANNSYYLEDKDKSIEYLNIAEMIAKLKMNSRNLHQIQLAKKRYDDSL